jgi:predicted DNA-binding mobile mystery protein A
MVKMKAEFRALRIAQLDRALQPFPAGRDFVRPLKGWIRAIREASGVTVREMAKRLGNAPSVAVHLERSEAEYRITLGKLREAADALGCQLVYALVPKSGSILELLEKDARTKAEENVRPVEHSMALENQAVGGVDEKIEQETKRTLKRSGKK